MRHIVKSPIYTANTPISSDVGGDTLRELFINIVKSGNELEVAPWTICHVDTGPLAQLHIMVKKGKYGKHAILRETVYTPLHAIDTQLWHEIGRLRVQVDNAVWAGFSVVVTTGQEVYQKDLYNYF